MKLRNRLLTGSVLAATLVATVAPAASAAPRPDQQNHDHHRRGAVFVQSDDPQHNTIISYDRSRSGSLRQAHVYRTGGKGGVLDGAQVDHLASQESLVRQGNRLFAVNAGSNTITVFRIAGSSLVREQVINSGGEFPVSIAASPTAVYVLNARDGGSIQGYLNAGGHLIKIDNWHRELGFDPDATPEFTSTPAQISFAPDRQRLVITTKGDGSSIETFRLDLFGTPQREGVVTELAGQAPFGFDSDSAGRLVVTEAGTNSLATFTLRHDGTARQLDQLPTGQQATCWVVVGDDIAYVSNAGSATVTSYRIGTDGKLTPLQTTSTAPGTIDAAISRDGRNLYVQTGGTGTVDEFRIGRHGGLQRIGSVTVPEGVGGEGIVAV